MHLEKQNIYTGDLLFFSGEDPESSLIKMTTHSTWSHVGIALDLHHDTLVALKDFIRFLPPNWKDVAAEVLATHQSDKFVFPQSNASGGGDGGGVSSGTFDKGSRQQHIAEFMVIYLLLNNNITMKKAINAECLYLTEKEKYIRKEDMDGLATFHDQNVKDRKLCLWESTTSTEETAKCLLTDNLEMGVKLTDLDDRACGYPGQVGRRKLHLNSYLDSVFQMKSSPIPGKDGPIIVGNKATTTAESRTKLKGRECSTGCNEDGTSKLYFPQVLSALICNIVINIGKPYERNFTEMINAWAYDDWCYGWCSCCCGGAKATDDFDSTSLLGENYNPINEYGSLYCSELAMLCLQDFIIATEIKDVMFVDMNEKTFDVDYAAAVTKLPLFDNSPRYNSDLTSNQVSSFNELDSSPRSPIIPRTEIGRSESSKGVQIGGKMICHPYKIHRELELRKGKSSVYYVNENWKTTNVSAFNLKRSDSTPRNPNHLSVTSLMGTCDSYLQHLSNTGQCVAVKKYYSEKEANVTASQDESTCDSERNNNNNNYNNNGQGYRSVTTSTTTTPTMSTTSTTTTNTTRAQTATIGPILYDSRRQREDTRSYSILGRTEVTPQYLASRTLPLPFKIYKVGVYEKLYTAFLQ
jgi:hypothetical protein